MRNEQVSLMKSTIILLEFGADNSEVMRVASTPSGIGRSYWKHLDIVTKWTTVIMASVKATEGI